MTKQTINKHRKQQWNPNINVLPAQPTKTLRWSSAGEKLKLNHAGNWRAQTRWKQANTQWRQLMGVFRWRRRRGGVAQDNQHQPDFKAEWHLTGRGHCYHPNMSWKKANIKTNRPNSTRKEHLQCRHGWKQHTDDSMFSGEMVTQV